MLIDSIEGLDGFSIPWADGRFLYFERYEARELHKELNDKIAGWDKENASQPTRFRGLETAPVSDP